MQLSSYFEGLAVSRRHTYLFSAGDDKLVKCWDLEQNKVNADILVWYLALQSLVLGKYYPILNLLFYRLYGPTMDILVVYTA